MKKEEFLSELEKGLIKLQIPSDEAEEQLSRFRDYFSNLAEKECETSIARMGGVDGVLASIAEYYSGSEEGGGEENGEETSEKETASPLLFRIGFLALFPVVVLLTAFSVLILSGLLIVLCVFTAAAGVLIPATAISGGALSLYALLSGVRLSFSSVPAGLFEIGIGLCAISLTLILSNLLFQAAFRLFPFLMKRILASFRTGADKAFAFISARWNGKEPDKGRREEV